MAALAVVSLGSGQLSAQDIEKTISDTRSSLRDPVTVNGSIGASSVLYRSYGIQPRRDPFYWVVNANLNFTILDKISVPFTAVFTQQDKNFSNGIDKFSQPFNQFGLSPRYRWLTVHAGYRSLEFSEYSLSGSLWLGGGVEINPEKSLVRGSAFYGRFLKAVPQGGMDGIVVSVPGYERVGGGAKVHVGREGSFAEFIFLKIEDDPGSIPFDTALTITPQENLVLALSGRHQLLKWLAARGEVSYSMLTKNLFQESYTINNLSYLNQIFEVRQSSTFNKVINTGLDFTPGRVRFGLNYKRVDPDYRSLGAVFLTNDVEELSVNSNFMFLKGKLNMNAATGVQRNNLDQIQRLTSRRLIGSVNTSYNVTEHINISLNYSNFSSNTVARRDVFTDTISFMQVTENIGFITAFAFGKTLKQQLTFSGTFQESQSTQQSVSLFFNSAVSYNVMIAETGWSFNLSALYNQIGNEGFGLNQGVGPQAALQKTLLRNKLRLSFSGSYQDIYYNTKPAARNMAGQASMNWAIGSKQNIRADFSVLQKEAVAAGAQEFTETRATLGYVYNFNASAKKMLARK